MDAGAIILGIVNLILLVGKFIFDWLAKKAEREKLEAERKTKDESDRQAVEAMVRQRAQKDNEGVVAMEGRVSDWRGRPVQLPPLGRE